MQFVPLILIWLFLSALSATIAHARGGDGTIGFAMGLLFGPFGLIISYFLADERVIEERLIVAGRKARCGECSELMNIAARTCPHCRSSRDELRTEPSAAI